MPALLAFALIGSLLGDGSPSLRHVPPADVCLLAAGIPDCSEILHPVASTSVWKFSRVQGTKEGETFASITKTADTTRSDPDFAGLIVRCAPKGKVDVLVALIRPFPPRSRPQVTIVSSGGGSQTFEASMAAAGAAVLMPDEVSAFASGKWQTIPSLSVAVKQNDSEIKGTVDLNGLREAYNSLLAGCSQ